MKKVLFILAVSIVSALPAVAQTSSFGFIVGGTQKLGSGVGFKFGNNVRELFFDTQIEPDYVFRIKGGEIQGPVSLQDTKGVFTQGSGKIDHIDGLVNYKFSEAFGSSGLFAGLGLYRQKLGSLDETNYGLSAGVNADFPLTRTWAVTLEGTYHWINFHDRTRYLTIGGGLKINF